ncbi:MAG: 50S ribosomal protein L5 [Candidatus Scalindua sp. AMX11]|nr:MAG: 50S ribosomal protein L5 [Candidatus Scalindua sp.]NOG85499.1 50S ribosomal protein L5 [Planctomycetota bacterium]RZV90252.1 MAG: 50S ribosomal protein L5 [Candidatus Scalindua sp. SCAELEC01]TDE64663.1 MAG: 50S ribosomal protein L5 [Candidatus Scalindua sp. AMX11]GJQ57501.1 MAG: 50S ribosomal protein L5 [Candidatus Scalindua sp.]
MARLLEKYKDEYIKELMERFQYKNHLEVPKLLKIVINMGLGKAKEEKKRIDDAVKHLATITGQKPAITKARKAVAGFKIRKGDIVGCKVTLRGKRAYEFLDRLVSVVLPRIKDFRGVSSRSFDGNGNYTLGISELSEFPEIDIDDVLYSQGMDITLVVSGKKDVQSYELLKLFGMPFKQDANFVN